jgi:hypothetical protein
MPSKYQAEKEIRAGGHLDNRREDLFPAAGEIVGVLYF